MQIPTLSLQLTPTAVRRELRYTLIRLRPLGWGKPYVTVFEALLKSCDGHIIDEGKLRDALEDAEAELDHVDGQLDEIALYIGKFIKVETSGGVRANLNRALFGSDTPSKFVRPRLGEELVKVRTWPTVLAGAPLAKLVALGKEVETLIKSCDAAVQKHSDATANLQAFLVNDWAPFVAKVNGERQLLGGEAKKQLRLDGSEGGVGLFRSLSKSRSQGDADSRAGGRAPRPGRERSRGAEEAARRAGTRSAAASAGRAEQKRSCAGRDPQVPSPSRSQSQSPRSRAKQALTPPLADRPAPPKTILMIIATVLSSGLTL
jgi:hypothetical protein